MLDEVARASRSLATASGLDEVCAATLDCVTALGLRGAVGAFNGDQFLIRAASLPEGDAVRLEEVLGSPLPGMRFPTEGVQLLRNLTHQRKPVLADTFPSRLLMRFTHLSDRDRTIAAKHLGAGPMLALPLEAGDALVGALLTWGGDVAAQRALLQVLATQAGMAWRTVAELVRGDPRPLAPPASADLAANITPARQYPQGRDSTAVACGDGVLAIPVMLGDGVMVLPS